MQITDELLIQHAAQARDIWLSSLPDRDEIPVFSCSKRFLRKMGRLLRQQRRSPRANRILRDMKRIAAVLLVVATITFAGLMTVEAFRERVIEVVTRIYHELTRYEYSSDKEATALPEISFGYLPDGMEIASDEKSIGMMRIINFENGTGEYLCLDVSVIFQNSGHTRIVDTEDAQVSTWHLRGTDMTAVTKNGHTIVLWNEENVIYDVDSNIGQSELERVISELIISEPQG